MIESIQQGKDIYASIAALAFNKPYEECLEFHPETHEYQPDGKARRTEAKSVVLGKPSRFYDLAVIVNAPSTEALVHRLLSANFVNCETRRCISHISSCRKWQLSDMLTGKS